MKFCKHCNYVLNISKSPINNDNKITYTIETMDQYLNYIKNVSTEINHEVELKIDNATLKTKLMGKFKQNKKKVDELLIQYDVIKNKASIDNNIYFVCQNCNSSFEIEPGTIILSTNFDKVTDDNFIHKITGPTIFTESIEEYLKKNNYPNYINKFNYLIHPNKLLKFYDPNLFHEN